MAGPGLRAVCEALGIPPVLHMGSCVDNSRVMVLAAALADYLGVDIDQLPAGRRRARVVLGEGGRHRRLRRGLRASPPCWACSRRSSGARTWWTCWPAASTTWSGAKFVVEPDPRQGRRCSSAGTSRPSARAWVCRSSTPERTSTTTSARRSRRRRGRGLSRCATPAEAMAAHRRRTGGPDARPRGRRRVVVVGKGGVGKSTLSALLARQFARTGRRVVAVDADEQRNLAATLGHRPGERSSDRRRSPRTPTTSRRRRVPARARARAAMLRLNPDTSDLVDRLSVRRPTVSAWWSWAASRQAGGGCLCPETALISAAVAGMHLHARRRGGHGHPRRRRALRPRPGAWVRLRRGGRRADLQRRPGRRRVGPPGRRARDRRRSTWWSTGRGRRTTSSGRCATWTVSAASRSLGHRAPLRRGGAGVRALGRRAARWLGARPTPSREAVDPGPRAGRATPAGVGLMRARRHRHRTGGDHRGRDPAPARSDRHGRRAVDRAVPAVLAAGHGRPLPHRARRDALLEGPRRRRRVSGSTSAARPRWSAIDADNHEVVLADGQRIGYEGLVVASGSRLHAPLEGADLPGRPRLQVAAERPTELVGSGATGRGDERPHRGQRLHRRRAVAAARRPRRGRHGHRSAELGHAAGARPGRRPTVAEAGSDRAGA